MEQQLCRFKDRPKARTPSVMGDELVHVLNPKAQRRPGDDVDND